MTSEKHGVHIREYKDWNTKTIYSRGHAMRVYRHQPKAIRFRSPMVNDFNQHLCGGWRFADIQDEKEATIQQLLNRRKPFASMGYWPSQYDEAQAAFERLREAGLPARIHQQTQPVDGWRVNACQDIRVCDIGNFEALKQDYAHALGSEFEEIEAEMEAHADRHLETFFDEWDSPPLPLWLTGLILGYPIENTISLYLE